MDREPDGAAGEVVPIQHADVTCPFLHTVKETAGSSGERVSYLCLSRTNDPITISGRYVDAFCLTSQHVTCSLFIHADDEAKVRASQQRKQAAGDLAVESAAGSEAGTEGARAGQEEASLASMALPATPSGQTDVESPSSSDVSDVDMPESESSKAGLGPSEPARATSRRLPRLIGSLLRRRRTSEVPVPEPAQEGPTPAGTLPAERPPLSRATHGVAEPESQETAQDEAEAPQIAELEPAEPESVASVPAERPEDLSVPREHRAIISEPVERSQAPPREAPTEATASREREPTPRTVGAELNRAAPEDERVMETGAPAAPATRLEPAATEALRPGRSKSGELQLEPVEAGRESARLRAVEPTLRSRGPAEVTTARREDGGARIEKEAAPVTPETAERVPATPEPAEPEPAIRRVVGAEQVTEESTQPEPIEPEPVTQDRVERRPVEYAPAEAVAPDEGAAPILKAEPVNPGESGASPEREVHIVASTVSPMAEQTALSGRQTDAAVSTRESVEPPPHVAQAIGVGGEAPAVELKGNDAIGAERSAPAEALSPAQADATPQMVEGLDSAAAAGYETVVAERERRPARVLARILGILLMLALLLSGGVLLRDRLLTSAPGKSTQTVPTRTASTSVAATGTPLPAPSGSWDFAALPTRPDQIILTLSNDAKEAAQVRVYNLGAGGKLLASLSVPASSGGELALDPGAASAPLRVLASAPIRVGRTVVRGGTTQFDYGAPGGKAVTPGKP